MEQEKKLYPFRFCTLKDEYCWGSEEFKLADLGYRDSLVSEGWLAGNSMGEIMDMYMDRIIGEDLFERYGRQFPFEMKYLRVKGRMPLRVHPDDETASQRYDFLGKEKLWHVVRAGKDARLFLGFIKDTDASEVYSKCLDGSVEDILNTVSPMAGQSFVIAPGTPHAAAGDIEIAEVSQSSPLDFCLCGWGQEVSEDEFDSSLNIVDALDFINYRKYVERDINSFTVNKIPLDRPLRTQAGGVDAPAGYFCTRGEASLQVEMEGLGKVEYRLREGEIILVPSEVTDYILAPVRKDSVLLEVFANGAEPADSYINPDVEATLEDDSTI